MVEWKPLNSIVKSISTGLNPRQNFVLNEENATLYYVTVKEITTNKVVFSDSTDRITEKAKKVINNRSKLREGDILFSGIGTIGKVAFVDIPTNNWDCSESVFLIKPDESITKGKFLAYILASDVAKRQYEKGASGAIMRGVRKATLESLQIPVPSLSEQERIVGILDTFTASIENLKLQIAERRKQYEHYRDELLDLEGKVEMKTLEDVVSSDCSLSYGIVQPGEDVVDGIPVVRPVDLVNTHVYRLGLKRTTRQISDAYKRTVLKGNEILLCVRGTTGIMGLATKELEGCNVTRGIVPISFDDETTKMFVYYQLKSYRLQKAIEEKTNGTALSQINIKDLRSLNIFFPSLSDQSRIVSILDTFEASIQNLEAQLKEREKQYEHYRNELLTFG